MNLSSAFLRAPQRNKISESKLCIRSSSKKQAAQGIHLKMQVLKSELKSILTIIFFHCLW